MNSSSNVFLYVFLPLFLFLYPISEWLAEKYIVLKKLRLSRMVLILFSLAFYAWACFEDIIFLLFLVSSVYLFGLAISKIRNMSFGQILLLVKNRLLSLKSEKVLCGFVILAYITCGICQIVIHAVRRYSTLDYYG